MQPSDDARESPLEPLVEIYSATLKAKKTKKRKENRGKKEEEEEEEEDKEKKSAGGPPCLRRGENLLHKKRQIYQRRRRSRIRPGPLPAACSSPRQQAHPSIPRSHSSHSTTRHEASQKGTDGGKSERARDGEGPSERSEHPTGWFCCSREHTTYACSYTSLLESKTTRVVCHAPKGRILQNQHRPCEHPIQAPC